ncbi:MAG: nitroreductase family protein [Bacteroidales bacterium]
MRIKLIIVILVSVKIIVITLFMTHFKPFRKNEQIVLDAIHHRTSIRSYTSREVPAHYVEQMLRAAMAAPSSRNVQPWELFVITDRLALDALAGGLPFAKMLAQAPMAIVVAGNTEKGNPTGEQAYNWVMDCSAATQNLLLTAHTLGLGAVWTGVWPYQDRVDVVRKVLNIPNHIMPLNVIPVGYPDGDHEPKDKWDENKIHWIGSKGI